jgi:hypothetical protein
LNTNVPDTAAPTKPAAGTHNDRLKAALAAIETRVDSAKGDDDLVAAIKLLSGFPAPIKYDNSRLNQITLGIVGASAIAAAILYFQALDPALMLWPAAAAVISLIVYGVIRMKRKGSLTKLSDRIYYRTSLFDYGLTPVNFSAKGEARKLGARFQAFRLGNYSREIRNLLRGKYTGAEHTYGYDHYHFHYVNRRTETYTTTDSKGNVRIRTRTVYDHFDRYGFIVAFKYARSLRISEGGLAFFKSGWKSASVSFNKHFNVAADSEMEAAKFLTPKVLLEIESAGQALRGMDLEFNSAGDLCFSFDDSNMIAANRAGGLEQPAAFADLVAGHTTQANLDAALDFIHTLMKYSDNNFG